MSEQLSPSGAVNHQSRCTLASYPGSFGEGKKEPGYHCLRMGVIYPPDSTWAGCGYNERGGWSMTNVYYRLHNTDVIMSAALFGYVKQR